LSKHIYSGKQRSYVTKTNTKIALPDNIKCMTLLRFDLLKNLKTCWYFGMEHKFASVMIATH